MYKSGAVLTSESSLHSLQSCKIGMLNHWIQTLRFLLVSVFYFFKNTLVESINSDDLQTLHAMFPHTPEEELEEALRSNLTIDFAIDELLSSSCQVNAAASSKLNISNAGRHLIKIDNFTNYNVNHSVLLEICYIYSTICRHVCFGVHVCRLYCIYSKFQVKHCG